MRPEPKATLAVLAAQAAGQPVICVDTKKKELVGNYRVNKNTACLPTRFLTHKGVPTA